MRKRFAAAALAASIAAGGLGATVTGAPGVAGAATGAVGWVQDALSGLVSDGTITQSQADAVATALETARPEPVREMRGGRGLHLPAVSEALGMTDAEVRTAIEGGAIIASLATERGVDVQSVIDAIVAAHRERLAERVAAGELTQEQADQMLAHATERATALVNGELPPFPGPGARHGRPGPGMPPGAPSTNAPTASTAA